MTDAPVGYSEAVLWVTPHGRYLAEQRGWSSRPAQLARALARRGLYTTILARTPPHRTLAALRKLRLEFTGGWPVFIAAHEPRIKLLEHAAPSGFMEDRLIGAVAEHVLPPPAAVIITDPRSASALDRIKGPLRVFDAYDAWDRSPLYSGSDHRVTAIRAGYAAAARFADLVTANTPTMSDRMSALGARNVRLVPNGAQVDGERERERTAADITYLGNIQPRIRVDLLRAAADVARGRHSKLILAGKMQVAPRGWDDLLLHPAVIFTGPSYGAERDSLLRTTAVGLVPHVVDDYTLSQDAMKVWDYLSYGIPVVGTSVPPLSSIPGLGTIADSPAEFGRAVAAAIDADSPESAATRRRLAEANSWDMRARSLSDHLAEFKRLAR